MLLHLAIARPNRPRVTTAIAELQRLLALDPEAAEELLRLHAR